MCGFLSVRLLRAEAFCHTARLKNRRSERPLSLLPGHIATAFVVSARLP
jgi:hypothetical protein